MTTATDPTASDPTNATMTVANRLVELCKEGKHMEAIEELYADDCVSHEAAQGDPSMPRIVEGKQAIIEKGHRFFEMMEVHGGDIGKPFPHQDKFIINMSLDATPKAGPMAGQRMDMNEMCLYTVASGKIVKEEFFYDMDC